jgi:hypothetical protein
MAERFNPCQLKPEAGAAPPPHRYCPKLELVLVEPGPLDAEALGDVRGVDHRSAMAALSGLRKQLHRATRDTFDVMVAQGPERDLTAYDLRRSPPCTRHCQRPSAVSSVGTPHRASARLGIASRLRRPPRTDERVNGNERLCQRTICTGVRRQILVFVGWGSFTSPLSGETPETANSLKLRGTGRSAASMSAVSYRSKPSLSARRVPRSRSVGSLSRSAIAGWRRRGEFMVVSRSARRGWRAFVPPSHVAAEGFEVTPSFVVAAYRPRSRPVSRWIRGGGRWTVGRSG